MAPSDGTREVSSISSDLLTQLAEGTRQRQIGMGRRTLRSCAHIFKTFSPELKNAAAFVGALAQWPYADPALLKRLVASFNKESRSRLTIPEYVSIRMAEGVVAMSEAQPDLAGIHFDVVLGLDEALDDKRTFAITNYWKAQCLFSKGEYEAAGEFLQVARELESQYGHVHTEAVFRVLESCVLLEKGEQKAALSNLFDAEAVLIHTDDYGALGGIQVVYGRILRREGQYGQAIEHFLRAIEQFKRRGSMHHYVAQSLVEISQTRLLVYRQLQRDIDSGAEARRKTSAQRRVLQGDSTQAVRQELRRLKDEIAKDLDRVILTYQEHPHDLGLSRAHLCRGHLFLDLGEFDLATKEAGESYSLAKEKQHLIQMTLARTLQCMIENAMVEEQVDGSVEHALAARDHAKHAIELAKRTHSSRLLARAYIWMGLTVSNGIFNITDQASEAIEQAARYLEPGDRDDDVLEDLQMLTRRLREGSTLASKLPDWVRTKTDGKTFKELEEDFVDLVIQEAWDKEGQKVSRAAARLAISPKRVRRVLARLGLHQGVQTTAKELDSNLSKRNERTKRD